jgi:starch synthase
MKITIVVGGRWHAFDLASELEKKGHLHKLITNYPKWFVKKWGIPPEKVISLPFTFWLVKGIYRIGGEKLMMRCQWWVHRWFAERAANYLSGSELIHGWSQWSEPSFRWAKENKVPTVLERSSAHILEQNSLLSSEYKRFGLKWIATHRKIVQMELKEYELSDSVAIPSLFVEKTFHKRGFPATKLFRNNLGVNLSCFKASKKPESPSSNGGLKIIFAGSISLRKGIPDLLEGFNQLDSRESTLTLLGGITRELESLFQDKSEQIRLLGHIPQKELLSHYQQNHCFVMASVEEGMAMVQMQALACGLPLVCTTNTGGEDLLMLSGDLGKPDVLGIKQFPCGFLIPVHSPKAISHCLRRFINEPKLWETMRNEALKLAGEKLSWEKYGRRSMENYTRLLSVNK